MAAEIFTALSALRLILNTETDADSPDNETTFAAMRVAIESLFMILLGTGVSGTVTTIAETVLTDTGNFVDSAHLEHTLVMTSGDAKGNMYTIDSNTVNALTCTGDTMVSDGVAEDDDYVILYDIKTSTGHTHNAKDAKNIDLADDSVDSEHYVADSIDEEHYAPSSVNLTALKSSGGSAVSTLANDARLDVTMQDYCFFPNMGSDLNSYFSVWMYGTIAASNYTGQFSIFNENASPRNYSIYWRYITASDEPFIYAVRDKGTGTVIGVWSCEDPPPGYWGLSEKPVDFEPPMIYTPALKNVEEIVLFKYPKAGYKELMDRSKADKVLITDMLTADFDFNDESKLFTTKNLVHI